MATSADTRIRVGVEVEVADDLAFVRFWFFGRSAGVLALRRVEWLEMRAMMETGWVVEDFIQQLMEAEDDAECS